MPPKKAVVPIGRIENRILLIRGEKVIVDADLAQFYGVPTKRLNEQVKRNKARFPKDFMFALTRKEIRNISQIVISSGIKHARNVHVFTEQGVAMLSSVLRSKRAIHVNIAIMRVFVRLRETLATHKELARKLSELENHLKDHDQQIQAIFDAIRHLMTQTEKPRKKIGFAVKEKQKTYGKRRKKN